MKYFDLIQKSLFDIKKKIRANENIRKLVAYDQPDALDQANPSNAVVDEKIRVTAVFDITEPPYEHNTFITIVATKIKSDEDLNTFNTIVRINVITQAQLWELNDDKIRPLEIANSIIKELEFFKADASNKLYFHELDLVVLDGNINGYGLIFHLLDGSGLDDEF